MKKIIVLSLLISLYYAKTITIAGTADLQGALEPSLQKVYINGKKDKQSVGGIAKIATLFAKLKKQNPNIIFVSSGDDLMNSYFHIYKGKAILGLMSDAGYNILAPGNHEFDKGIDTFAKALENTKFTTLCSDLDIEQSPLKGKCKEYLIKDFNSTKVGFFSLITKDLLTTSSVENIKFKGSNVEVAKNMIKLLKSKGANVIVLVSHIGYKEDVKLAKQVKGIDLIFGGHSHSYTDKISHYNKTAIVNGGELGSYIVKVDIPIKGNCADRKNIKMQKILIDNSYKPNQNIATKLKKYKSKLPKTIVLGTTKEPWNMSSRFVRKNESPVADMINDLMRKKYKVDIVLNNSGAFRGNKIYPKGNITNKMLKEIDEFANSAYLLTLKGKYIKQILNHSGAQYGKGGFMQVSGIKYTIDLKKDKNNRLIEAKILENGKWAEIKDNREYKVLTNAFISLKGGDGYYHFKKYGTKPQNTYATFYSILTEALEENKELTPKKVDGRIKVIR
jgi:5'-nucleotidase